MEKLVCSKSGLSNWQRRMAALGDLSPDVREKALWGEDRPPLNLIPVTAVLHDSAGCHTITPHSTLKIDGPACFLKAATGGRPDRLRDEIESVLGEHYPGVKWSTTAWDFIASHQKASIAAFKIRPSRTFNFLHCYTPKGHGYVMISRGDPKKIYRMRLHCNEAACLYCHDMARRRRTQEKVEILKKILAANPGCPGFLELIPTLPEKAEHVPLQYPEVAKQLMGAAHILYREIFGVSAQSNIAAYVGVHPVGTRDLFRNRWHPHIEGLPARIVTSRKTGDRRFEWLRPCRTAPGHKDHDWMIDEVWLQKRWNELLEPILKPYLADDIGEALVPRVVFVPMDSRAEHVFWEKVTKKLHYILRGWGREMETAVLRTAKAEKLLVLKGRRGNQFYWIITSAQDYAQRWKWLQGHNKIATWGFLQALRKYSDVLGIVLEDPNDEPPDVVRVDAEVETVREKKYDPQKKRVVWIRDEIYTWTCPITGERLRASKRELLPWRWPLPRGLPRP